MKAEYIKKPLLTAAAAGGLLAAVLFAFHSREITEKEKLSLAATTNVLSSLAYEISGGTIEIVTLIPPGNCPGYFDMKVSTLQAVESAGVLLAHGFEEYLPAIQGAVSKKPLKIYEFPSEEGWMTPGAQLLLGEKMLGALCEIYPVKEPLFKENFKVFSEKTRRSAAKTAQAAEAAGLKGMKVICNEHLIAQLEYFGIVPAASYGRGEALTAPEIRALIKTGLAEKAEMVIDNFQAGPDTGKALAGDIGAAHAVCSNFPGGFPDTPTLSKTMEKNLSVIISALEEHYDRN